MFDYTETKGKLLDWLRPEPPTAAEEAAATKIGHGDYEIYTHKIDTALDEARTDFVRTAVSTMAKSGDLVVSLHNASGDTVAASCGTYLHAPIAQLPVKFMIDRYVDSDASLAIEPGDIFYANEALTGGLHNPDQMAVMPIFSDDEQLVGWGAAALHQAETGAIEPGGMPNSAQTRYDEGMRLTPIKIAEDYEIRPDLMDMMVNFVSRSPRTQEIDVRARCTAVDKLRKRVKEIVDETSTEFVGGLFRRMIDTASNTARDRVSSWRDGTYRSVGFFDTVGNEETLMKLSLELRKEGEQVTVDFTGTSPEAGSYNTFGHGVAGFLGSCLYPYVFHDIPVSTGAFDPFRFELPEGTVVNANPEASVANCVFPGRAIVGLFHTAFTKLLYQTDPERIAASPSPQSGAGQFTGINQHGVRESNVITYPLNTDGQGARPDMDGMDAHGFFYGPWGKSANAEADEESRMLLGHTRSLHRDTCGFGKYRGGCGTQAIDVVVADEPIQVSHNGNGTRIPLSSGVFGGYSPTALFGVHITDSDILDQLEEGRAPPTDIRELLSERALDGEYEFAPMNRGETNEMEEGDIIVNINFGAPGIGDPIDRDPEAVASDVREGQVSEWAAENVFGVEVDDGTADEAATAERREAIRERRLERSSSFEEFQSEWEQKRPPEEALEHYGEWPQATDDGRETLVGN